MIRSAACGSPSEADRIGRLDSDGRSPSSRSDPRTGRPHHHGRRRQSGSPSRWRHHRPHHAAGRDRQFPCRRRSTGDRHHRQPDGGVWFPSSGQDRPHHAERNGERVQRAIRRSPSSPARARTTGTPPGAGSDASRRAVETRVRVSRRQAFSRDGEPDDALWFTNRQFFQIGSMTPPASARAIRHPRGRGAPVHHPRTGRQPLVHHDFGNHRPGQPGGNGRPHRHPGRVQRRRRHRRRARRRPLVHGVERQQDRPRLEPRLPLHQPRRRRRAGGPRARQR